MKESKFSPRVTQSFDIPPKVRVSLYVASKRLAREFEAPFYDNRLLKAIADGPYDKATRSRLMSAKLSSRLSFDLVEAEPVIEPLESFLEYLAVPAAAAKTILEASHLLEVTAVEGLSENMAGLKIVNLATALLARELGGVIIEPYSLKIYPAKIFQAKDKALEEMISLDEGTPSLKPFLAVVQSVVRETLLTTTHGLCRFGLPDLAIKSSEPALAGPIAYLIRGLAQSYFEAVLRAKAGGLDRFSLAEPVPVTGPDLKKANSGERFRPGKKPVAQKIPLVLERKASGPLVRLALHGRRQDKDSRLREVLAGLGLIPAGKAK